MNKQGTEQVYTAVRHPATPHTCPTHHTRLFLPIGTARLENEKPQVPDAVELLLGVVVVPVRSEGHWLA